MIDPKKAQNYAQNWIAAWNGHDIDAIMDFYADSLRHVTPKLTMLFGAASHKIEDKKELRDYFEAALKRSPDLQFTLQEVFSGAESIVIIFDSTTGIRVAVTLIFDADMKITRYMAHYRG
ncbi:MAG: nuclear transport factor 2 family protein [Planctomycetota bacterium]|jgi:hypothetical protein